MYRIQVLAKVACVRALTPCPLVHRSGDGVHAASTAVRNLAWRTHPGRVSYLGFVREFGGYLRRVWASILVNGIFPGHWSDP